jgi:hypothetical protein
MKLRVSTGNKPGLRLSRFANSRLFPLRLADIFLLLLLKGRDPLFLRLLDDADNVSPPALQVLLRMYGSDYRGLAVSAQDIRGGLAVLKRDKWMATRSNALYFLLAAIKNGDLELVREVLDAFPAFSLNTLPAAYKTGILRLAASLTPEVYAAWRDTARPSALEALQIQNIDHRAGFSAPLPHAALGAALSAVVPSAMQNELKTLILPFYETHSKQMRWMDCRNDPEERAAFLTDIVQHLRDNAAYSLVRLGDGESYAWQDRISPEHAAHRERIWWGEAIDPSLRAQVGDAMLKAITVANRLGVPSLFRFARDTHPNLGSYTEQISIVGLIHALNGLKDLAPSERLFTEERIHQLCFDLPTIARLCAEAEKVVIVSSLTKETIRTRLQSHIGDVPLEAIEIPTHTRTFGNDMFVQAKRALPYTYQHIEAQVAEATTPGTLVLVASGSVGKVFCAAAQRKGGVALDVGAMIDYWVGLKTRSIADMG